MMAKRAGARSPSGDDDPGIIAGHDAPGITAGDDDPGPAAGDDDSGAATGDPPVPASYEQARDELATVVDRLEDGGLTLDESLALWERGQHLAAACERFLAGARERVEAALAEGDGEAEDTD